MILKNKRTGEQKELTLQEFKKEFDKEIKASFKDYVDTQLRHIYYGVGINSDYLQDFYFDLRYNFNNFGISAWYIEKI